jgi:hypothetical protein
VLFTFPSRYLFTIGRLVVFSLMPWSASIHAKFHVHRVTQGTTRAVLVFGYGSLTLYGAVFQPLLLTSTVPHRGPITPRGKPLGLGCSAFARHYLRNRIRFIFLRLLRCFTSPGVTLARLCIQRAVARYNSGQVTPFGNFRINTYLPFPGTYRSLSRPSSSRGAKAFTMRSL